MNKKSIKNYLIKISVISLILFSFISLAYSAPVAIKIGYVDVDKVFNSYKGTELAKNQLALKEQDFMKDVENARNQIKEAENRKVSEEVIENLKEVLTKTMENKKQELMTFKEELTKEIQNKILKATDAIRKRDKYNAVFDKNAFLAGGDDLTNKVIKEINK